MLFNGRYLTEDRIGQGAAATVWRGRDLLREDRPVAVKLPGPGEDPRSVESLLTAECHTLLRLRHPGVVRLLDHGVDRPAGQPYLVMEFVDGEPLLPALANAPRPRVHRVLCRLAAALDFIHTQGFVHGDLKPAHILVTADDRPVLLDLGLAFAAGRRTPEIAGGTLPYLAPELLEGGSADGRADLYALGVILFELLEGRLPFEAGSAARTISKHLATARPRITKGAASPHAWLAASIESLLARDPADRPTRAVELIDQWSSASGIESRSAELLPAPIFAEPPLLGREQEMTLIATSLDGISAGRTTNDTPVILVEGEAGSGRSRLLREVRSAALIRGCLVIESPVSGPQGAPTAPWSALLTALRPYCDRMGTTHVRALERCRRSIENPGASRPEGSARSWARSTGLFLASVSRVSPIVVLMDDREPPDPERDRLLEEVAGSLSGSKVLLLLARTGDHEPGSPPVPVGPTLSSARGIRRLRLRPLDREGVRSLLSALPCEENPPGDVVEAFRRQSGGNPLLLREALETSAREGLIRFERGRWTLPSAARVRQALPRSLPETLSRRVSALPPELRREARRLAILGDGVPLVVAREALSLGTAALDKALEGLDAMAVTLPAEQTPGRIVFAHPLLPEILGSELDAIARRGIHRAAARAYLDRCGTDEFRACSHHALHSGDRELAMEALARAVDGALAAGALRESAGYLRQRLDLTSPRDPVHAETGLRLAGCLLEAGDYEEVLDTLVRMETSGSIAESQRAAFLRLRARALVLRHPLDPRGPEVAREAARLARENGDMETAILATKEGAVALARRGSYREALSGLEEALDLLEHHPDPRLRAEVLTSVGMAHLFLGDLAAAAGRTREAQAAAFESGHRNILAGTFHNLALIYRREGRGEAVIESAACAARLYGQLGHPGHEGSALCILALARRDMGRYDQAISGFLTALEQLRLAGDLSRQAYCLDALGDLLRICGRVDEAVARHGEALAIATGDDDPVQESYARGALARDYLAAGDTAAARREAEKSVLVVQSLPSLRVRSSASLALAHVDIEEGRYLPAIASAVKVLDFQAGDANLEEIEVEAHLVHARGQLGIGDDSACLEAIRAALRRLETAPSSENEIRALWLRAEVEERTGRRSASLESYRRAVGLIRGTASSMVDEALRRDYLAVTWRREILERHEARLAPGAAATEAEMRLEALYDIVASVNSLLDPEPLLERVMDIAVALVGAERGLLILEDAETGELDVRVARGVDTQTIADARTYSKSIVREAGGGSTILAVDAGQDDRFLRYRSVSLLRIKSLVCVPLRLREKIIGTVYLDSRLRKTGFSEADVRFLEAFAHHAAIAIENARHNSRLREENELLRRVSETRYSFGNLVGRTPVMQRLFSTLERAAASDLPVLIEGESGTGKELIAHALHFNGARRSGAFVTQNCAAIPETLLESELFGYARGAFTGADTPRKGLFEMAHRGTLFLDEIGDLPLSMQPKLLRALEQGEIRPLGARRPVRVDVRLVSSTNRKLRALVEEERFRGDLFYRLNVLQITTPPLRERREDIPLLAEHFLARLASEKDTSARRLDADLLSLLVRHDWPGNVRELENVISRLALVARGDRLTTRDLFLDPELHQTFSAAPAGSAVDSLRETERRQIQRALEHSGGNRKEAARLLGISKATIFRKLRQYGIQ